MIRIVFCLGLVVFLSPRSFAVEPADQPLRVLFIGNSYTSFNNLPGLVAAMAEAGGGRKIVVGRHLRNGGSFERHVKEGAIQKIGSQPWDVVVLQEQSMMPIVYPERMQESARQLHVAIKQRGAQIVFFLTWARQNKPETQTNLNVAYDSIARELGAMVAPVGVAWHNAMAADDKIVLHRSDKSHPNPTGSYLAACVFYATLLEKSPEGLPGTLKLNDKTLTRLDEATARQLQAVAWKTIEALREN